MVTVGKEAVGEGMPSWKLGRRDGLTEGRDRSRRHAEGAWFETMRGAGGAGCIGSGGAWGRCVMDELTRVVWVMAVLGGGGQALWGGTPVE